MDESLSLGKNEGAVEKMLVGTYIISEVMTTVGQPECALRYMK